MAGMVPRDVFALTAAADPRLSPDGSTVAFVVGSVDGETNAYRSAVWLAAVDGSRTVFAISAAGYLTTRHCPAEQPAPDALEDCPALRPEGEWSAYPRIRAPGQANTVTLHREANGAIRLRVNGERLGAAPVDVGVTWGVWARAGGSESPRVAWEWAEVRAPG